MSRLKSRDRTTRRGLRGPSSWPGWLRQTASQFAVSRHAWDGRAAVNSVSVERIHRRRALLESAHVFVPFLPKRVGLRHVGRGEADLVVPVAPVAPQVDRRQPLEHDARRAVVGLEVGPTPITVMPLMSSVLSSSPPRGSGRPR